MSKAFIALRLLLFSGDYCGLRLSHRQNILNHTGLLDLLSQPTALMTWAISLLSELHWNEMLSSRAAIIDMGH